MTDATTLHGHHLVNGQWLPGKGEPFHATDPASGRRLEPAFRNAHEELVNQAFAAAGEAFAATRDLPGERWARLLEAIADEIEALGRPLLERAAAESGLPVEPRLMGERGRTCGQLRLFARLVREGSWVDAVIDTADPDRQPPRPDIRRMLRPLGPVVVFDASNFPLAFGACGGDTASALAAGNPVLVKSHPAHPGTGELCARAVQAALKKLDLPAGLFALLQGNDNALSQAMVVHPQAAAVGFTGSQRAGRALFDLAAQRPNPIPFYAEMGSLNPLVILPAALEEKGEAIARGLAGSVTLGAGQFCTKPGLVFVPETPRTSAFLEQLAQQLGAAGPFTMLNPGIRGAYQKAAEELKGRKGLTARVAGRYAGAAGSSASLFEVDSDTWRGDDALRAEVFGPATLVVRCRDLADLEDALAGLEGNLTGSLHTGRGDDPAAVRRVAAALEQRVGRLIYNGYPTGVEVCHAMVHGGPYPATTAAGTTSVGTAALCRFARPVAYQDAPADLLPPALRSDNPLGLWRTVNGELTRAAIGG